MDNNNNNHHHIDENMAHLIEQIKHTVDATIPDKEELTHGLHPKIDYWLLILRNVFVSAAVVLFLVALIVHSHEHLLKAIAYFCGAAAYVFELRACVIRNFALAYNGTVYIRNYAFIVV